MKEFEKKIITVEDQAIRNDKVKGEKGEKLLNDYIEECQSVLSTTFNDDEKLRIKENPNSFLKNWIKELYQFPNASDEFNNQALGIDIDGLIKRSSSSKWNNYDYVLQDGMFKFDDTSLLNIHTKYTSNKFENDCVDIANELINIIDLGIEKGVLSHYQAIKMSQGFTVLSLDNGKHPEKHHNICVNPSIQGMKQQDVPKNNNR